MTDDASGNDLILTANFAAGGATGPITEDGLFVDDPAGEILVARLTRAVINKSALDTLTLTWSITQG